MSLPPDFKFSQNNLQDFLDCERRFELRYLLKIKWPSPQTDAILETERRLLQGNRFHKMIEQFLSGITPEAITPSSDEIDLSRWWENFIRFFPTYSLSGSLLSEYTLGAPFNNFRLVAKFDLLAIEDHNKLTIMDWKTSLRRTSRVRLKERMQTRVYLFLLVLAGNTLISNTSMQPDQVELIYWFAEHPDKPEIFRYSREQYLADEEFLSDLLFRIQKIKPSGFQLTSDEKKCIYCRYRSLCNRGAKAGAWQEMDEGEDISLDKSFDPDQIGELAY
jgi:hypothetical protein